MQTQTHVDYQEAQAIVGACMARGAELGGAFSICVLDGAGHPVLMARQDGAAFQTVDVARGKALTAVMMRKSSKEIEDAALQRPTLATFSDGRLPIQGGLALFVGKACVGSVAASGGTPDQDELVARAGAEAFSAGI